MPSGENAMALTQSVCPTRVATALPVAASHSRAVLSAEPVRTRVPSGENAAAVMLAVCPRSTVRSPQPDDQLRHAPSSAFTADPKQALTNAFAGFVGKRIEADQHRTDMITLTGLLVDNSGEELCPVGRQFRHPSNTNHSPSTTAIVRPAQDRGPSPLNSPDIVLGTFALAGELALRDKAFTLGKALAFLICEGASLASLAARNDASSAVISGASSFRRATHALASANSSPRSSRSSAAPVPWSLGPNFPPPF